MVEYKNINSLKELSKFDKQLRKEAIKIAGGDKELGEDALQDSYLFFHEHFSQNPNKSIDKDYIFSVIINYIENQKYGEIKPN